MPSYNARGDRLFGFDRYSGIWPRGESPRLLVDDTTRPAWLTDDLVVVQGGARQGTPHVVIVDRAGQVVTRVTSVSDGGRTWPVAGEVQAGGGRWAAFLSASPSQGGPQLFVGGVNGPTQRLVGVGKHSVGGDGTLVYASFHGVGVTIDPPDGPAVSYSEEAAITTSCLGRATVAWWPGGSTLRYFDGERAHTCRLAWPAYGGTLLWHRGQVWVIYVSGSQERCILHPVHDSTRGYLVGPTEQTFAPDAIDLDGRLRVLYARNAGERAETVGRTPEIVREELVTGEPEPWPEPVVALPSFDWTSKRIGIGMFDQFGEQRADQPHLVVSDWNRTGRSKTRAMFHTLDRGQDLDADLAHAEALGVPLLVYRDGPGLRPAEVPVNHGARAAVRCYPGDTPEADVDRLRRAGVPWDLVIPHYRQWVPATDGYAWSWAQVIEMITRAWALVLEHGTDGDTALWAFAYARRSGDRVVDGYLRWESIRSIHHRLLKATANPRRFPRRRAAPVPEPEPTPEPPATAPPMPPPTPPKETPVTFTDRLLPDARLEPDGRLYSHDRRFRLHYQLDGNLVVYGRRGGQDVALWSAAVYGHTPGWLHMQLDGNLVAYHPDGTPYWATDTYLPALSALMQSDGNLVLEGPDGVPRWDSRSWRAGDEWEIQATAPTGDPLAIRANWLTYRYQDHVHYIADQAASADVCRDYRAQGYTHVIPTHCWPKDDPTLPRFDFTLNPDGFIRRLAGFKEQGLFVVPWFGFEGSDDKVAIYGPNIRALFRAWVGPLLRARVLEGLVIGPEVEEYIGWDLQLAMVQIVAEEAEISGVPDFHLLIEFAQTVWGPMGPNPDPSHFRNAAERRRYIWRAHQRAWWEAALARAAGRLRLSLAFQYRHDQPEHQRANGGFLSPLDDVAGDTPGRESHTWTLLQPGRLGGLPVDLYAWEYAWNGTDHQAQVVTEAECAALGAAAMQWGAKGFANG